VYWVVPGRLAAGPYPEKRLAFDTFVDLTEEGELARYEADDHRRHPIADFGVPTVEAMDDILADVDAALADGRTVYLHCRGGKGRTGMAVACWLIRRGNTSDEALAVATPETDDQIAFVRAFADHA